MAKFSNFGASGSLSLSDFNKRTAELSEKLGEMHKPEARQRSNRMQSRGKPAPLRKPAEE
jgi:hypothetical protein